MAKIKTRQIVKPAKGLKKSFKKAKKGKKKDFTSMSVDTFLEQDFEGSASDSGTENPAEAEDYLPQSGEAPENDEIPELSDGDEIEENADESGDEIEEHKEALSKLRDTDPEFYKFLEENDKKLLQFNVSDDEGGDEEDSQADNDQHRPPEGLELASDESDFEVGRFSRYYGWILLK